MISVPVGPDLIEAISLAIDASRPIMLMGTTGVGKSQCLEQAAKAKQMEYICRDLSLMEAPDLAGLPIVKDKRMSYAAPGFLPQDGSGLMVFEELNRAPRHTQAPCLQLLTARCLNDYKLPEGWHVAAAVNPDEDGYVVEAMDKALLARFTIIQVVADPKAWLKWAESTGIHATVQQYVRSTPKIFEAPSSNPRAWAAVSEVLYAAESGPSGYSRNALMVNVAGLVGDELATSFLTVYRNPSVAEVPTAERAIKGYPKVRARVRKAAKDGDASFLNSLCHGVLLHLQDPDNEKAAWGDQRAVANLQQLLADLPGEFRAKIERSHRWLVSPGASQQRRTR